MAFNREAALAEGYTEDEINAFMQAEAAKNKETPVTSDPSEPPAPQTTIQPVAPTAESTATTAGLAVAPYALPAAAAGAAALGGSKLYSGWKSGVDAANQYSATQAANAATHAATQELKTLRDIAKGTGPEAEVARQRIQDIIKNRPVPGAGSVPPGGAGMGGAPGGPTGPVKPASMSSRVQAHAANMIKNLPGATSGAGKMVGKVLPGAGTVLNAYDAYDRAKQGDYTGAALAGVGAAASPFPVIGTGVGMATGAINAYRDYRDAQKRQEEEAKKRMAQQ